MREPGKRWAANTEPASTEDWAEVQEIERDIIYLYHEVAPYNHIMSDLYWGSVFKLPYWEYVDPSGLDYDQMRFIGDGCLVMLLTMAWQRIETAGWYIDPHIPLCRSAISQIVCIDTETRKLIRTVDLALTLAEGTMRAEEEIGDPQGLSQDEQKEIWEKHRSSGKNARS